MPGGVEASSSASFTFLPTPAITEILPTSGPLAGGTNLTILGQHLLVPGTPIVNVAGVACELWSASYLSDNVLKVGNRTPRRVALFETKPAAIVALVSEPKVHHWRGCGYRCRHRHVWIVHGDVVAAVPVLGRERVAHYRGAHADRCEHADADRGGAHDLRPHLRRI